jgi:phosphoribosylglycinamide formyltransferase 1
MREVGKLRQVRHGESVLWRIAALQSALCARTQNSCSLVSIRVFDVKRLPIGILGSGKGSNCRAILERIQSGRLAAEARVVISDVLDAAILDIAREFSVANAYLPPGQFRTRLEPEVENELVKMLRDAGVHLVVLAGFMRVLHAPMLNTFPRRIINIHPALLPKFPGLEAWKQALAAGEVVTGCTVHFVDDKIDHGQIIAQREVPILPNDTPESLHARIQVAEHELYPAAIAELCEKYAALGL